MATVTECKLIDDTAGSSNGDATYTLKFRAKTDDREMPAALVYYGAQAALPDPAPVYYSTLAVNGFTDYNVFCKELDIKRAKQDGSQGRTWIITCGYKVMEPGDREQTSDEDPLTEPVRRWIEWEDIQEPVEEARNVEALTGISRAADTLGPMQNAAGGEPSSPLMRTRRVPVLCVRRNYTSLATIAAIETTYGNTVSDGVFYGAAARCAAYRSIECSQPQQANGTEYYTTVARIAIKDSEWYYAMVNRGYRYLDGGVLKEATVKDADDNDVASPEPINLELDGTRTADGDMGTVIHWLTAAEADYSAAGW